MNHWRARRGSRQHYPCIEDAFRVSDGAPIKIINLSDPNIIPGDDYGIARRSLNISTLGPVRYAGHRSPA